MSTGYQNYFKQQVILNPAHHAGMGELSDVRLCKIQNPKAGASLKMGLPQATQLQFEGDACPLLGPHHPQRMK